jgi:hypothetical protein
LPCGLENILLLLPDAVVLTRKKKLAAFFLGMV